MSTRLLFVHALSPLHAGTGQSVGAVELAIARDRATGFPYLPGSSIKGSLRDRCEQTSPADVRAVFGPDTANAHEQAGALIVGDANLLLLPVRSIAGTFAWVTSRLLLARFARDAREAGVTHPSELPEAPAVVSDASVTPVCKLKVGAGNGAQLVFEDLDLQPKTQPKSNTESWAHSLAQLLFPGDVFWQQSVEERFAVVHDDVMGFLSQHATDVVARVALSSASKTVDNLWHEENLPVETMLTALLTASPNARTGLTADEVIDKVATLTNTPIQLGGKATVGRGRCRLVLGAAP